MKRVAVYMRVSSDKQAQEGDSIPAQRDALHKYIDNHPDMVCIGEYLDDGISGTKADRDELQRMLSDVRDKKIDLILVTKLDRLYRNIRHYLNLQDTLDRCGVNWLAIWEPIYDTTTPQGRLIINQMMSIAQFEAENTGQRIRQVQAYKISQGEVISGSTPVGYKIVNKHLVPDENADIVRQAFEYYSLCGNADKTIRAFDHYGIFPRTKPAWKFIFTNTKYIGVFRDNDHFCEPIISKELFEDVQRKIKMNVKKSQKHTYIFSGLIRCAECGRVMAGTFRKMKRGKEINMKSYRCPAYYGSVKRCGNSKTVEERTLEKYMLDNVRKELQNIVFHASVKPEESKDNKPRISALKKRLDKIKELFVNDLMTIEEYKVERETIQNEITELETQENKPLDTSALETFLSVPFEEMYKSFTDEEKRYLWRSVTHRITFSNTRQIELFFIP